MGNLWDYAEEGWDGTFNVNLKGYLAMMRAAIPHLAKQDSSSIVNTSSGSGFGHPGFAAYATSKEGVVGLTRTAAKELGRFGIRCNAIRPTAASPGTIEFMGKMEPWDPLLNLIGGPMPSDETYPYYEASHPAWKVSPFVVWLCTDAATSITGRTFDVGGDHIALIPEPGPQKWETEIVREGGFDLDTIDELAPTQLIQGLDNPYTLDGHPELQAFPS